MTYTEYKQRYSRASAATFMGGDTVECVGLAITQLLAFFQGSLCALPDECR